MRRFWILGVLALGLFSHSLIASLVVSLFENFFGILLTGAFLAKLIVWWHDRPKELKHRFDDPHILD